MSEPDEQPDMQAFGMALPITPNMLRDLFTQIQTNNNKAEMNREADDLRLRRFVEGLNNDQLHVLLDLMHNLAEQGERNYGAFILYGILLAETWRRKPIDAEAAKE